MMKALWQKRSKGRNLTASANSSGSRWTRWRETSDSFTGDEVLSWNQIYETIADALGTELHPYHVSSDFLAAVGDPYGFDLTGDKAVSVVLDNRKIKRLAPDMTTHVPFHKGVRIALSYILSHEECQKEDREFDEWCDRVIEMLEEAKGKLR